MCVCVGKMKGKQDASKKKEGRINIVVDGKEKKKEERMLGKKEGRKKKGRI